MAGVFEVSIDYLVNGDKSERSGSSKQSHIGDSKGSMENLRKAMEILPKTTSSNKPKKK